MACETCGYTPGEFVVILGMRWSGAIKGLGEFIDCDHAFGDTEMTFCLTVQCLNGVEKYHGRNFGVPTNFVSKLPACVPK
jgi:hypothetical protein